LSVRAGFPTADRQSVHGGTFQEEHSVNIRKPRPDALPAGEFDGFDTAAACLYAALLFFSMTVQTGTMTVILVALALVLSIGRGPLRRLRERLGVPLIGFLGFALMNGLAAIYASLGEYAVAEFNKFAASFSLAVLFLTRFDRKHVRALLWGLAAVCAVIGLLCVDMGCWRGLFEAFSSAMEKLGMEFTDVLDASAGGRVNGLYRDANITGALLGPAILVCMYLVHTSEKLWQKAAGSLVLGVCSVGFLTAMSRGAIAIFFVSALVYLAAERGERLRLFFLMCATAVSMLACGGYALTRMELGDLVPDVMCFVCGLVIFLLDWGVSRRLVRLLEGRGKLVTALAGGFVVLACGFVVLALNLTGPAALGEGDTLYRSVKLEAGTYQLSGDWDGAVNVGITARSRQDALMNRDRALYSGPMENAEFTVEEDGLRVGFRFSAKGGGELRAAELSNGVSLKLKYRLLPEMIAFRLQDGLLEGFSFLMRTQYDKDGWRLFLRSPLIGFGLGSSETWLTSLQPFYYESLYLHNHILQVLCDMGVVGLVFWLSFLGGVLWLLIRALRKEKEPLAAALLGCWVMMFFHGLMEIDFSIRAVQCEAWLLLLIPVVMYTKPVSREMLARMGCAYTALFLWGWLVIFGGLLVSRRAAAREMENFSTNRVEGFLDATKRWIKMDVFDHEQNQLNFVGNAVLLDDARYTEDMERYVEELRSSGTYTACSGLAAYYYLPLGQYEELFACSREGVAQEASVSDAWNQQFDFYRQEVLSAIGAETVDIFVDGVLGLQSDLEEFSEGRMEDIQITAENQEFVSRIQTVREQGMEGAAALLYLTVLSGAGLPG